MERIYRVLQEGEIFFAVDRDGELRRAAGDPFTSQSAGVPVRGGLDGVRILAPVQPSKIVCVGLNYKDHAAEQGKALPAEPLLRGIEGWVNDERRQASNTTHLIFPIEQLVEFVTFVMTLEPGDIISTGTPEGIGPIRAGDVVRVRVDGVGELVNPVEDER